MGLVEQKEGGEIERQPDSLALDEDVVRASGW